ncbi:hypothetical protein PMAYCL1PPCAC_08427, partial [Pristionchus mayeri]
IDCTNVSAMTKYTLYYFNLRARAEVVRQLFALAGEPFEDVRVTFEEWENTIKQRGEMPFDALPVLDVDGTKIAQSMAIARFLARKFGYAGKSLYEQSLVDSIADQYADFYPPLSPYRNTLLGLDNQDLEKLLLADLRPQRDEFFGYLVRFLRQSGSGFLVGQSVTFADLLIAEHVTTFKSIDPHYVREWPEIEQHWAKIRAIPNLAKWISERPKT